jgi:uncharacterized lipoprotein YmbA
MHQGDWLWGAALLALAACGSDDSSAYLQIPNDLTVAQAVRGVRVRGASVEELAILAVTFGFELGHGDEA